MLKRPRLRSIDAGGGERHASWFELFFDLVFVLAVANVAKTLGGDFTPEGALRYVALFALAWWAWVGYTFYADRFESEETTFRLLMFAGMLAVAAFAVNVRGAFTDDGARAFALSYVAVRAVLIVLYVRAAYYVPLARELCVRYIIGFSFGSLLWVAAAFAPAPARYYLAAAGLAVELLTPFLALNIVNRTPYDTSHIPERFGLFTIIVLGEAVVAAANGAAGVEWDAATMLTAAAAFAVAGALWWIHFDYVEDQGLRSDNLAARNVYLYAHFFLVAGIVAAGLGAEHAITEAHKGAPSLATRSALCGGLATFLAAITVIRLATGICRLIYTRLAAIAILLLLLVAGAPLSPLALVVLSLAVLVGEVWLESIYDESAQAIARTAGDAATQRCAHLDQMRQVEAHTNGCEECLIGKQMWVHLRLCLTCGHVGCCDSSRNKHATAHFRETGHPLIASLEAGESWTWCYIDERFVTTEQRGANEVQTA